MKYELAKMGTNLQLIPLTTELLPSCRQAQVSGGKPHDLKPNILFEFKCVGPGFAAVGICRFSHLLKEAAMIHLNYCETNTLNWKHIDTFCTWKPRRGKRRRVVGFMVNQGYA